LALWADHRTLVEGGERKVVPMRQAPMKPKKPRYKANSASRFM
jgi:hypothetical protein